MKRYYAISEKLLDKAIIQNKDISGKEAKYKVMNEEEYNSIT